MTELAAVVALPAELQLEPVPDPQLEPDPPAEKVDDLEVIVGAIQKADQATWPAEVTEAAVALAMAIDEATSQRPAPFIGGPWDGQATTWNDDTILAGTVAYYRQVVPFGRLQRWAYVTDARRADPAACDAVAAAWDAWTATLPSPL